MELILRSTKRRVKKKVERDHYWYDPETKQRLHGKGGRMIFVYDRANKKSVPRIIDSEEYVYENSYDAILKWIEDNDLEIKEKAPNLHVTVEVKPHHIDDLTEDLYKQRIQFEYDHNEHKKETKEKSWQNSPLKWQIRH